MFCVQKLLHHTGVQQYMKRAFRCYSKRSAPKVLDTYKVVKSKRSTNNGDDNLLSVPPNWELLTPYGYKFFLPGSVGLAWHDATSIAHFGNVSFSVAEDLSENATKEEDLKCIGSTFEFSTQDCPILLRKGVSELFNGLDFTESSLTILSLSCKTSEARDDPVNEDIIKTFVLVAQEISARLRMSGYWADFINPFSGRPCLSPSPTMPLYETDPRFRCLDFQIVQRGACKVIGTSKKHKFTGSLFTTAPSDASIFNKVFSKYE